ncbi:MAG: hypothetical protein WDW38_002273 [Sanguina aurantia]
MAAARSTRGTRSLAELIATLPSVVCNYTPAEAANDLNPHALSAQKVYVQPDAASCALFTKTLGQHVIKGLGLFGGAGALDAALSEVPTKEARIEFKWYNDINPAACATVEANYPHIHVYCMGIDQFLMLMKCWVVLCKQFSPGGDLAVCPTASSELDAANLVVTDVSVRLTEDAKSYQAACAKVFSEQRYRQAVGNKKEDPGAIAARTLATYTAALAKGKLVTDLLDGHAPLVFKLAGAGPQGCNGGGSGDEASKAEGEEVWVTQVELLERPVGRAALAAFVRRWQAEERLPVPGSVGLIAGGPPCQDMSGHNLQRAIHSALQSVCNRLVVAFFNCIQLLQPGFVVMEQVPGRTRLIILCAKSGVEVLPPCPENTHHQTEVPRGVRTHRDVASLNGRFASLDSWRNAYPPVVLADVMGDIRKVEMFSLSQKSLYRQMDSPFQLFSRRPLTAEPLPASAAAAAATSSPQPAGQFPLAVRMVEEVYAGFRAQGKKVLRAAHGSQEVKGIMFTHPRVDEEPEWLDILAHGPKQTQAGAAPAPPPDKALQALWSKGRVRQRDAYLEEVVGLVKDAVADGDRMSALPYVLGNFVYGNTQPLFNADDLARLSVLPLCTAQNPSISVMNMRGACVDAKGWACIGHCHTCQIQIQIQTKAKGAAGREAPHVCPGLVKGSMTGRAAWVHGCPAYSASLPTGSMLILPYHWSKFRDGKQKHRARSAGRLGDSYGRLNPGDVPGTIVGRMMPMQRRITLHSQAAVMTLRMAMRCQGFSDQHILVGSEVHSTPASLHGWLSRCRSLLDEQFQQTGNAVPNGIGRALGGAICMARSGLRGGGPVVHKVDDRVQNMYMREAARLGLSFYAERARLPVTDKNLIPGEIEFHHAVHGHLPLRGTLTKLPYLHVMASRYGRTAAVAALQVPAPLKPQAVDDPTWDMQLPAPEFLEPAVAGRPHRRFLRCDDEGEGEVPTGPEPGSSEAPAPPSRVAKRRRTDVCPLLEPPKLKGVGRTGRVGKQRLRQQPRQWLRRQRRHLHEHQCWCLRRALGRQGPKATTTQRHLQGSSKQHHRQVTHPTVLPASQPGPLRATCLGTHKASNSCGQQTCMVCKATRLAGGWALLQGTVKLLVVAGQSVAR